RNPAVAVVRATLPCGGRRGLGAAREHERGEIRGFARFEAGPRQIAGAELLVHLRRVIPHRGDDGNRLVEVRDRREVGANALAAAYRMTGRTFLDEEFSAPIGIA